MKKITRKSFIQKLTALAAGIGLAGKVLAEEKPKTTPISSHDLNIDMGWCHAIVDGQGWRYSATKAPMEFERVHGEITRIPSKWEHVDISGGDNISVKDLKAAMEILEDA